MDSVEQAGAEVKPKLAAALIAARKAFGPVLKDSVNPHFGNKYAQLSSYIDATAEALAANGLHVMQRTLMVGEDVCLETLILHTSGETMQAGLYPLRPTRPDPQGFGSALTYARRYCYAAALNLASEDDDASDASQPAKRQTPKKSEPTLPALADDLRNSIMLAARKRWSGKEGITTKMVAAHLDSIARGLNVGATGLADLPPEHVSLVLDAIENGSDPA